MYICRAYLNVSCLQSVCFASGIVVVNG